MDSHRTRDVTVSLELGHMAFGPSLHCCLKLFLVEAPEARWDLVVEVDCLVPKGTHGGGCPAPGPHGAGPGPQLPARRAPGCVGEGGDDTSVEVGWLARLDDPVSEGEDARHVHLFHIEPAEGGEDPLVAPAHFVELRKGKVQLSSLKSQN